jgi:hypothetical protein
MNIFSLKGSALHSWGVACYQPVTDHDVLYEDVIKGHRMNRREQLDDLLPQIRDKHVSDRGNVARKQVH